MSVMVNRTIIEMFEGEYYDEFHCFILCAYQQMFGDMSTLLALVGNPSSICVIPFSH